MFVNNSRQAVNSHLAAPPKLAREAPSRSAPINISALARKIGTEPQQLIELASRAHTLYSTRFQRKPTGGFRLIQAPNRPLKAAQRQLLKYFDASFAVHRSAKSGFRGARPLDHARPHVGHAMLITADIEKCFDNVRSGRIGRMLVNLGFDDRAAAVIRRLVTRGGSLPQGAPTSSLLLNLVLFALDERLTNFARRRHLTYTRYADDLAFSGDYDFRHHLGAIVGHVRQFDLKLSHEKTLIFPAGAEQVITKTIAVNDGISFSTTFRQRLKADADEALEIVDRGRLNRRDLERIASAVGRLAYARTISPQEASSFRDEYFSIVPSAVRASAAALMNRNRRTSVD